MEDLKFGIFDHLDRGGRSISDLFEQRLQIVEQYDRAGFHAYHLAEHHSTPLGMAPSPSVFLSAVAQRTKALRFGPLVYLLPLYHPLRLAEEIAMLDQMSHGRLEVGIGRGRSPIELMLYGTEFEQAQDIFDETLSVLQLAFSDERLSFAGKHFDFQDVPIELRPLQKPHPPIWYGIGSPESAKEFGARGFHGVTLAKPAAAAEVTRRFYEASAHAGWRDRRMGVCRFIVVGDTDREARRFGGSCLSGLARQLLRAFPPLWTKARTDMAVELRRNGRQRSGLLRIAAHAHTDALRPAAGNRLELPGRTARLRRHVSRGEHEIDRAVRVGRNAGPHRRAPYCAAGRDCDRLKRPR